MTQDIFSNGIVRLYHISITQWFLYYGCRLDTAKLLLYNKLIEVYNLTAKISEQEIVAIHTFLQRVDDRDSGGVMVGRERIVNGPVRVHRKRFVSRLERLPPLFG